MAFDILESGSRETFKGAIHAAALALAAVMGLYNSAAWMQRRKRHLAVNALVYAALVVFERQHVRHHWTSERALTASPETALGTPAVDATDTVLIEKKAA